MYLPPEFHVAAYVFFSIYILAVTLVFYSFRKTVIYEVAELEELAELQRDFSRIEDREARVARLLGMTPAQLKTELKKNDMMTLMGIKTAEIIASLKRAVPLNYTQR